MLDPLPQSRENTCSLGCGGANQENIDARFERSLHCRKEATRLDIAAQALGVGVFGNSHDLAAPSCVALPRSNRPPYRTAAFEELFSKGFVDHACLRSSGVIALQNFAAGKNGNTQSRKVTGAHHVHSGSAIIVLPPCVTFDFDFQ